MMVPEDAFDSGEPGETPTEPRHCRRTLATLAIFCGCAAALVFSPSAVAELALSSYSLVLGCAAGKTVSHPYGGLQDLGFVQASRRGAPGSVDQRLDSGSAGVDPDPWQSRELGGEVTTTLKEEGATSVPGDLAETTFEDVEEIWRPPATTQSSESTSQAWVTTSQASVASSQASVTSSQGVVSTTLSQDVVPGAQELFVASEEGFASGDGIVISGGGNSETRTIVGFGSVIVDRPLVHGYPAGSVITKLEASTETAPPSTSGDDDSSGLSDQELILIAIAGGACLFTVLLIAVVVDLRCRRARPSADECSIDSVAPVEPDPEHGVGGISQSTALCKDSEQAGNASQQLPPECKGELDSEKDVARDASPSPRSVGEDSSYGAGHDANPFLCGCTASSDAKKAGGCSIIRL